MKSTFTLAAFVAVFTVSSFAEAPTPFTDLRKTLSAAAKDQKMTFIHLGRRGCDYCNETKGMIHDGKIPVTSADYVMAYLNADDEQVQDEFMGKYGKENFGDTLPYVVVTDAHGKTLASSGGPKNAGQWKRLLAKAKAKVVAKAGSTKEAAKVGG
jgi:hypothetical protein